MELGEKDIYEAFDLDFEGEKDSEGADPQLENEADGGNGQDVADPADSMSDDDTDIDDRDGNTEDTDEAGKDDAASNADEGGAPTEKKAQSPEERAKHAAARRKAEKDAAVAKARSEAEDSARKEIEELLALSSLKDPSTGKAITTREEFIVAKEHFTDEKNRQILRKIGMTKEELDAYISDMPEIKAAREAAESARRTSLKAKIDNDIAEISKIDPSIKSIEDLAKDLHSDGTFDAFYEKVNRGYSFIDAYKLLRGDVVLKNTLEAAKAAERRCPRRRRLIPFS